ncbi:MAG: SurA N-terminal domain-containing protein [Desulfomonilaceae bacterium]
MLDLMRKHARAWFIKVALGAIIVTFVFIYGWSGPGEKSGNHVAEVNGTVITSDHFYKVYDSELEKIRLRFKGALPADLLEKLNLKKSVVQGLVNQVLLLQEAGRLGLMVTDEDVVRDVRSNPSFQREGVFDLGLYRAYLSNIKLTPSAYETLRKQELLEQQVVRLLTDAVKTDPEEIKRLWHFQNDKLVLSVLLIKADATSEKVSPDPKDLEAFFKEHEANYEVPPSLKLQYVAFSWHDLEKTLSVSDEEALTYFQNHPKEFTQPEQIRARHILLRIPNNADKETREEIHKKTEEILSRIKAGEDFAKTAKNESQDEATADKGGDLGFFSRGSLNPALEAAAFKLDVGMVSEPILTPQGYDLIKVEEKKTETEPDFASVKDKIVAKLLEEKARKKVDAISQDFYEQVYRREDLQGPAKQFGLQVKQAESVTKAGSIPDLGHDPKIMDEAFQLKKDDISKLLKIGDNYVVMKLLEKSKERLPALDEVRSIVEKDYLKQQAMLTARKKAEEVIEELKKNPGDAEAAAKKFGVTWEKIDPVSRTAGFTPKLGSSPEVSEMLTTLSMAAPIFPTPISAPEGAAVVRLVGLEQASDEQYAKEGDAFERWVIEVRKTEFLKGWLRLFEEKSKITINDKML